MENENSIEFLKGRGEFTLALSRFAERKLNYNGLEERIENLTERRTHVTMCESILEKRAGGELVDLLRSMEATNYLYPSKYENISSVRMSIPIFPQLVRPSSFKDQTFRLMENL